MTARRVAPALAALVAACALTACGERPQVIQYKQGTYQGKPDTRAWESRFHGNRQEWENAVDTRNQAQNEYKRIN